MQHEKVRRKPATSETELQIFFNLSPDLLCIIEPDGTFGQLYEVFLEIPQRRKEVHKRCLQGAVEQCEDDLFIRANGEKQWVKWLSQALANLNRDRLEPCPSLS